MKCIPGEGMPTYRDPYDRGVLLVRFDVEFPKDGFLAVEKLTLLEALLPKREECIIPDGAEEVTMVTYNAEDHARQRHRHAYVDDDDDDDDEPRVQCASQ